MLSLPRSKPYVVSNLQYYYYEHKETTKATCVEFLGAKIEWKPDGYLDFWVFDKFDVWNFSVIKFPHADSNAAEHQSPGIVTGQLNRFRSIINSVKALIKKLLQNL